MKRDEMIARIETDHTPWDFVVIGGGATGVGCAIEAASRGHKTLLLEQGDFGQGTSSRSTKLIHGGVRYLQQGNLSLVLEALKERGLLLKNAPHLVHNLPFIVPNYDWWESPFYGVGLKLYDVLAGKHGFGDSKILSKEKTVEHIPTVETEGLRGGVIYYDGQFDDSRLVINMVRTAYEQGATLLNYMNVTAITKTGDYVSGVRVVDVETETEYQINAKAVVNATGVFADSIRKMDDVSAKEMIHPSQGVHIVVDRSYLPGDSAIMVPHTDDGRVLFAIPWHDRVLVGTTDTAVKEILQEPKPLDHELKFLLEHAARYLSIDPGPKDVLSCFAGLRPLVSSVESENTATISRDHTIHISGSGLVTITGGKWTTYRRMAEETIDQAEVIARVESKPSVSRSLQIHGYHQHPKKFGDLHLYGADAPAIRDLISENKKYQQRIHPELPFIVGEIVWAVRYEMARSVTDFLSRRTRALLLNARISMEMADKVAEVMGKELGNKRSWRKSQIDDYRKLAKGYVME